METDPIHYTSIDPVSYTHLRDLKDEEKDLGLTATVIARDGIAVIVNKDNDVDELTSDQVKAVYTGETTTWEDLAK